MVCTAYDEQANCWYRFQGTWCAVSSNGRYNASATFEGILFRQMKKQKKENVFRVSQIHDIDFWATKKISQGELVWQARHECYKLITTTLDISESWRQLNGCHHYYWPRIFFFIDRYLELNFNEIVDSHLLAELQLKKSELRTEHSPKKTVSGPK